MNPRANYVRVLNHFFFWLLSPHRYFLHLLILGNEATAEEKEARDSGVKVEGAAVSELITYLNPPGSATKAPSFSEGFIWSGDSQG